MPLVQNQSFKPKPTNKKENVCNDEQEPTDAPVQQSFSLELPPNPEGKIPDSIKQHGPFTLVINVW